MASHRTSVTVHSHSLDAYDGRHCTDEADQLATGHNSDTSVPGGLPAWGAQCPAQEVTAIVKPEHVVLILHIVLVEELVQF